jgi:hypothetical protein
LKRSKRIIETCGVANLAALGTIVALFIALSMASCKQTPKYKYDGPDTLAYTYLDFKVRDKACGDNPDSTCTIVKLNYPDFKGHAALKDSITREFIKLLAPDKAKSDTGKTQLAADLINDYTNFKKANPKTALYFLIDGKARVVRQDRLMFNLEVSGFVYNGGVHGVDYTGYINWNLKKDKPVILDNILDSGYRKPLTSIAEQLFRKNEKLSDTSSLNNGRTYFFKDGKFSLPDTYLLTDYGIKFLYNVYTIKPYAAGKTYLMVPYDNIRPLIKPHFGFTKNG